MKQFHLNKMRWLNVPDQGTYEQRIIGRLGPNGWRWLEMLADEDPETLTKLCLAEKQGLLPDAHLEAVISRVAVRAI